MIVALPDDRGLAIECVESLTRQQTYPRDWYEVIVVSDGTDLALESQVKAVLGSHDRLITHTAPNLYMLYDLGAREAKAKLLFFIESHAIAEPECLEELVNFLAAHDYDGASCLITGIAPNVVARMQARMFDEGFRIWSRPGDWRLFHLLGSAIYRDTYLNAGGFRADLYRFAEVELAAKLHGMGRHFGYAARAIVRHLYHSSFRTLFAFDKEYTWGECAARMSAPVEVCERYFGHAPEWAERASLQPRAARSACRASWQSIWNGGAGTSRWSMPRAQATAMLRLLPIAMFGSRWRLLGYQWSLWVAMARFRLWRLSEERTYRAFRDIVDSMIRYTRVKFIAEHLHSPAGVPPNAPVLCPADLSDDWLVGFHAVERCGDDAFRWSGPVAIVRLGLPRGTYEVSLETRDLRQAPVPLCLGVFFNRHRVPPASLRWHDGSLTFRLDPAMFAAGAEQHHVLTCNPVRPWTSGVPDWRELGLPIFSIDFAPITEAGGAGEETTTVTADLSQIASGAAPLSVR